MNPAIVNIFGEGRYYIDCKRRIGNGAKFNIPDAYLLDLKANEPRLFVVENELASNDLKDFPIPVTSEQQPIESLVYEILTIKDKKLMLMHLKTRASN